MNNPKWRGSLLTWLLLLSFTQSFQIVMAVDRSKFRTCDQTSFCRRHRKSKPEPLKQFSVDASSMKFTVPTKERHKEEEQTDDIEKPGIWSSIFGSSDDKGSSKSRFVGPAPIFSARLVSSKEELQLTLHLQDNGISRIRVTETDEFIESLENFQTKTPRWTSDSLVLKGEEMKMVSHVDFLTKGSTDLQSYVDRLVLSSPSSSSETDNYVGFKFHENMILLRLDSFELHLLEDDQSQSLPTVSINAQNLMYFEQRRSYKHSTDNPHEVQRQAAALQKEESSTAQEDGNDNEKPKKEIVGYWEDGKAIYSDGSREDDDNDNVQEGAQMLQQEEEEDEDEVGLWEEKFQSHFDSKPNGPMSVGLDISFPKSQHLFGIPEHASETLLRTTIGENSHYSDPYRLYNLDVFEYELDETMALYGSIPFLVSHRVNEAKESSTVGVFWFNPTETFIDVYEETSSAGTGTHWMSESGIVDIFLLPGGNQPSKIYKQYASLTGYPYLPPTFALGYHQCRWNYRDENDALAVHTNFEKYDYPYDVLWLDIEHTDGKRYFTWDTHQFPNPIPMQKQIASQGRKMVTIVDPHIKRDNGYYIHKQATSKKMYIRDKDGKDFDGWCWPGSSSYPDFTNARVREWWAHQFHYSSYKGSTETLYTWNDMNEPSVFNGPEVSMQKDTLNLDNIEHREWHNLYGMTFHRATSEGLILRNKHMPSGATRPFVLSRSFFAGSQQYGPIWTGDNTAEWSHLVIAAPMLLSLNIAGLPFVGADVGGFFGNPDAQLMVRWNQAGAYQPFFRGHAHHDSKRREPWVFGEETLQHLRKAAMARYALIPYWYTTFWVASTTGMPIMRPMWMEFPTVKEIISIDDQYLIGSDLLIKPITSPGQTSTEVAFPQSSYWYDVDTMERVAHSPTTDVLNLSVEAPLDKIPVYQRGGSIISRKVRLRRSVPLMFVDPYTLYIALDANQSANGILYNDDENSFSYEIGEYTLSSFSADLAESKLLKNNVSTGNPEWNNDETRGMVERIVILGLERTPSKITVEGQDLVHTYDPQQMLLVIKKPNVSVMHQWEISFDF